MHEDFQPRESFLRWFGREACDWIETAMMAMVCVVLLFTFVARLAGVDGSSMMPTLENQDRLIVTRIGGGFRQGDIVVITLPSHHSELLVKRVIATGGQTLYIDFTSGIVYVDGQPLYEPYVDDLTLTNYDMSFPQTVPEGHVFVMGDNRNNSWDSRDSRIGMIDERHLLGRAVYRVFPYHRMGIP